MKEVTMSSYSRKEITHGFVVLTLIVDEQRSETEPVWVACWDSTLKWYDIRVVSKAAETRRVKKSQIPFIEIAADKLRQWAENKSVPYHMDVVHPWTSDFWLAAKEIMTTAVQLSGPKAMARMDSPETQIDSLFDAVVKPHTTPAQEKRRVDGELKKALGVYAGRLIPKMEFDAFGKVKQHVLRGASGRNGSVIVEAVNLAASKAVYEADALVSRMQRIKSAQKTPTHIIVGYISSPGGLNGETYMRDWIKEQVTTRVYDLSTQRTELREDTSRMLQEIGVIERTDLPYRTI